MDEYFIDRFGNNYDSEKNNKFVDYVVNNDDDDNDDFLNSSTLDLVESLAETSVCKETKPPKNKNYNLNDTYLKTSYKTRYLEEGTPKYDLLLKNSQHEGLEKLHSVPIEKQKKALVKERKRLRQKTKGEKWFDMPATELTEEIKTDFEVLRMRSVLDKNHVYKKNDITRVPKYFQVGQVIESPADFYGGRIPKTKRKKTIVDELLADAEFKRYQKKKFKEIMNENRRKKHLVKNSETKIGLKKKTKSKK